jgi:ATP-dependent Lon protease
LEKVKKRILEYLALKIRNPKAKAPILCLAGAPGVGKTSLAKSIANALGKVYIKMSLGGMHDESEIRGHRKTYLGSMPGRIIKCMRQAKVNNPLFLLDEIDKLGVDSGNKGDPSSALLEVLDPEQNSEFVDNFIEEKYDLSNVMFVATANYIDRIPSALLDRLELIELSSYTEREKLEIAKNYLVKRAKDECLIKDELEFDDASLLFIIRHYTRESGVRELTRIIQTVCRKFIVNLAHDKTLKVKADEKLIVEYLGKVLYDYTSKEDGVISGIVNGMAYTSAGGDLLKIEATVFPGKGNIIITGNLKETMKESAQVALGFVRSNAAAFGIKDFDFANKDIHIHAPAGGIPKDGPSAGVTLTTAIISSIRNVVIPNNISMTGEITLRGKVGIVGGIKEKVISAFRGGVNEIFLPKDDERYLEDVPAEIKDHITFHLIDKYTDIYDSVFKKK